MPIQRLMLATAVALTSLSTTRHCCAEVSEARRSPIVVAVEAVKSSVVNIQGQKIVSEATAAGETSRSVNGMGTGVVIDPRGYILTNAHVVDGVRQINVKLDDGRSYIATPVAADKRTDLAVIRIRTGRELPVIEIGSSSDLMTGESVIAVGNAYGYEHTVTRGIVSAQHRDVQVSETQAYEDLIQTDASINPGNSGGPLLNIEGRMVGVNVAVRAGAQGIGFAIPVDKAMEIAADLMSIQRLEGVTHGVTSVTESEDGGRLVVRRVAPNSPAARIELQPGDIVKRVGEVETHRALDLERALLGQRSGATVPVEVVRGGERIALSMTLGRGGAGSVAQQVTPVATPDDSWELFGLSLREEPRETFAKSGSRYSGGMRVLDVRADSPAAAKGIREGDILVGMHTWETASDSDVRYIVSQANAGRLEDFRFYILRGEKTLYGDLKIAATRTAAATSGGAIRR
ncbi:trypsin-like peptidase domain-containing protein [Pirellulimonas nuda]|uniref:trypsin-like peptidase domain-containing protein n=1 Tax=Pirellulimonas nuda TaxID=2528009 RepID=UPI001E58703E|nr:trypsin-like peptidase domain-containing protein [Pirellulimonas nuda]